MWISSKRICLHCRRHTGDTQEIWVQSLCQEDTVEKEMAAQYSCLENPMDRGAWWATVHGSQRVGHNSVTKQHNNKGSGWGHVLNLKVSVPLL